MILERLPATAILAASSILLSLVVSIPLGIFAASKPNSKRDYFSGGLSMLMMATPNFFVGLVFIYLFAIVFQILPYDPAMPGAFLPADRRLGKTYAKQYA